MNAIELTRSFVDHQVTSDYPISRATEAEALARGYTMKAFRGTSRACIFNASGSTWASSSRDVAYSYAVDYHGFFEPVIAVLMINPSGLPQHDASRLTEEQRAALDADEFGNPQAIGIYSRSDDHILGGGEPACTVMHVPVPAVLLIEVQGAAQDEAGSGSAISGEQRFFEILDSMEEFLKDPNRWFALRADDVKRQLAAIGMEPVMRGDGSLSHFLRAGVPVAMQQLTAVEVHLVRRYRTIELMWSEAEAGMPPSFFAIGGEIHVCGQADVDGVSHA